MHIRERGSRRRVRLALAGTAAVAIVAASACVTNPGDFTLTVKPNSTLIFTDGEGDPTLTTYYGLPACADGLDNDVDGLTDFGSDAQCDSATDANERVDNVQTYQPASLPVQIDAAGVLTADPTDFTAGQVELCLNTGGSGVWCLGITLEGSGSPQTGSVNSETGEISLPLSLVLQADALVGFSGLDPDCSLGPITATYTADDYNTTTGATTLVAEDVAVGAVTECAPYNSLFNSFLALPGEVDGVINATVLDGDGDPIDFD